MAISIRCPQCATEFDVPDTFAGKLGKCPECNAVLRAPGGGDEPAPTRAAPALPKAKPLAKAAPPAGRDAGLSGTVRVDDTLHGAAPAPSKPAPLANRAPAPAAPVAGPVISTGPAIDSKHAGPIGGALPQRGATGGVPQSVWLIVGATALAVVVGGGLVVWSLAGGKGPTDVVQGSGKPGAPTRAATTPTRRPPPAVNRATGEVGSLQGNPLAKPLVAKTIDDVRHAMVKISYPAKGGQSLGSGFLIDGERAWVATNHHVIHGANSAIRCTFADGKEYAVAGLIADAPEMDLAIIKLADAPFKMTYLDINFFGEPQLGSDVFSYGHPQGVQFSLVNGIVSNVSQTQQLDQNSQAFLYSTMKCSPDHQWIQHNCNIHPGNSGGPLLSKDSLKVIGVNTWVNAQVRMGYASHVQYLRDLKETAQDEPRPFPAPQPGDESGPLVEGGRPTGEFSVRRLTAVAGRCSEFQWQPSSDDEYNIVAEFAFLVTVFKELQLKADFIPQLPQNLRAEMGDAADRAFLEVDKLEWTADRLQAFARQGAARLGRAGVGLATTCSVEANIPNGLVLKLEDGGSLALAETSTELARLAKGTRLVIFGMTSPAMGEVKPEGASEPFRGRVIKVNYAVQLK